MSQDDCAECVFWMSAVLIIGVLTSATVIVASLCLEV